MLASSENLITPLCTADSDVGAGRGGTTFGFVTIPQDDAKERKQRYVVCGIWDTFYSGSDANVAMDVWDVGRGQSSRRSHLNNGTVRSAL